MSLDQPVSSDPRKRPESLFSLTWVPRIRSLGTAATALALAATLLAGAPTAPSASAATQALSITWIPCRDGFECATVEVPLDYDRPHGEQISLALIRLPAAVPHRRIGSLFMNPGGPGGSGVDLVRGIGKFLPTPLRAGFDIVGFDPRGIMRSTPLRCFRTLDDAFQVLPPFAFPITPRQETIWRASDLALANACERRGGQSSTTWRRRTWPATSTGSAWPSATRA